MRRMLAIALAACVAGALTACMGHTSDVLDAKEYAQRATAICLAAQGEAATDRSTATTKAQLDRIDESFKRREQRWLQELRALAPPPELRELATTWLAAVEEVVREWDKFLDASAGRISWSKASLARLDRASARADRLAEELGASGCTRAGIGEGFRPYSLTALRRALAAHGVRSTAPTDTGTAFGYACRPPDGWRLLLGRAWTAFLFRDVRRADQYSACLNRQSGGARAVYLQKGNVVVITRSNSIPTSVRAALADLR
jgi:hypothetical protein